MKLNEQDVALFYKLWYSLVWGINEKHRVIPHFKKPVYGACIPVRIEEFVKIRDKMWDNPAWIDEFLADTDDGTFTEKERGIIDGWRKHFVKGQFLVTKHLAKYSILMQFDKSPYLLYGVCGISDSIKDSFESPLPFLLDLVLLPFDHKIIYDSLAVGYNVAFGSELTRSAKQWYEQSKQATGVIEVLNGTVPVPACHPKPNKKPARRPADTSAQTPTAAKGMRVPKAMVARYNEIAKMIALFCDEKLNEEYKQLSLCALAKISRKRPSPLEGGKARTWACGIVYAIGSANFIFDKSQPLSMTSTEIAGWFGLSKSTAGSKASQIADMLDISHLSIEYMLKSRIDTNPAIWLLQVNGMIVDIRDMPIGAQEEALRRGLIPYIPAEKGCFE